MRDEVYGNGLTQATMVRSQDQNNEASLFVGISPILLPNGTVDDVMMKFELYNIANKGRYPDAAYNISMVRNEYSPHSKDLTILDGIFLTSNGFLTLYINNSDTNQESGEYINEEINSPLLFSADSQDRVNLTIPFQLQSGQYHIRSVVTTSEGHQLSFDSVWQAGEIKSTIFPSDGQLNNVTAISYYEKIRNFSFDFKKRAFTWEIPFDYNLTRINEGQVNVHEEIIIPNSLIKSMNVSTFNMTMNNRHFDESLFVIDSYTIENKTIIHYVPNDNALFEISSNNGTERNNWLMKFILYLK